MNINPEQGHGIPGNDEPDYRNGGGDNIFGLADILNKFIRSKPLLLPLLKKYGFFNKRPLIRTHKHTLDKDGNDTGFREFNFGTKTFLAYIIFAIELVIRLFMIAIYLTVVIAIILVVLRGLELPEYVQRLMNPQPVVQVRIVD